jgi:hypothetical protein
LARKRPDWHGTQPFIEHRDDVECGRLNHKEPAAGLKQPIWPI